VLVDAGCGVGRTLRDLSALAPEALVLGLDGSLAMLELARSVVRDEEPIEVDLSGYGFGALRIPARPCPSVHLFRADIERLPVADGCADLVLSVNTVDRLPHGPEKTLAEAHRVLRPGGTLVFTDPLNWTDPDLWRRYPDPRSLRALLETLRFEVTTWFDDLLYHEILDARGSVEEFRTAVVAATR
jgi:SAM-dependent methyltransferase